MTELKIAIIADTHIRPKKDDGQFAFPSDHLHNDRAKKAVSAIKDREVDLVIHMGDVVHPLPHQESHSDALEVANRIFSEFEKPFYILPGNHDIGDKSNTANAPVSVDESRKFFKKHWGPLYQVIEKDGILIILLDSILLCSKNENEQRAWLDETISQSEKRIFIFSHFPPFLIDEGEAEHYDNYDLETRGWFLDLIKASKVEAVFSAHVHRFFYNRIHNIDFYTVPATSFIRPEYAGLRTVAPSDSENGRNDIEQLGVSYLRIDDSSHRIDIQKIYSDFNEIPSVDKENLGLWLHRKLGARMDIEYSDLDLLKRKSARYDHALIHILDLGMGRIRIPLMDLEDKAVLDRVHWLHRHNIALTVYSPGIPRLSDIKVYNLLNIEADWEWVLKENDYEEFKDRMSTWKGPRGIVSRIGKSIRSKESYHSHFPRIGFEAEDNNIFPLALDVEPVAGAAFRLNDKLSIEEEVSLIIENTLGLDLKIHCHVEIPFHSEAKAQTDDSLVNAKCLEIQKVIKKYPDLTFYIDLLQDKDRGYWCRNGLVDRNDKPRMAYGIVKGS